MNPAIEYDASKGHWRVWNSDGSSYSFFDPRPDGDGWVSVVDAAGSVVEELEPDAWSIEAAFRTVAAHMRGRR